MVLSQRRVGIFVDIQNLYHSAKHLYSSRVNYKELLRHLTGDRTLVRALAYVVKTETTMGEASFFEALKQAGLELRVKDIQIFAGGVKKADWDVGMAVDAIRTASTFDTIVIVTGDGDFVPLVEYLRIGLGKEVEVAGFSRTTNSRLRESPDKFIAIEDIPKILIKIREKKVTRSEK